MANLYSQTDENRFLREENHDKSEYRSQFRRDLARIVHSHSFRRLAGKTQLFPKHESDFFRNRLTHSLEVAQVAKSIALKLNQTLKPYHQIDLDLVELAGLAHDLGHPPFGHQGEEMLAFCMKNNGGFEGNAQTLRILSKLEKKVHSGQLENGGFDNKGADRRGGLNLTYRSLASILKYDNNISTSLSINTDESKYLFKGYYDSESNLVDKIKKNIGKPNELQSMMTVECKIMDVADDITYSTYDIEDALKAGFISPIKMLSQDKEFYQRMSKEITEAIHEKTASDEFEVTADDIKDVLSDLLKFIYDLPEEYLTGLEKLRKNQLNREEYGFLVQQYTARYNHLIVDDGYVRSNFCSQLIKASVEKVKVKINRRYPQFSQVYIDYSTLTRIEILKNIAFKTQILSPRLKANEYRGKRIIRKIFEVLDPKSDQNLGKVPDLLPEDYKVIYCQRPNDLNHQYRTVCDYISCMTDQYAKELYSRITSENPVTIFRPF